MSSDTSRISPTAYYTGYVWVAHGLAPREFATRRGATFYRALGAAMRVGRPAFFGMTLEDLLVQRHLIIDALLSEAIERFGVRQVLEVPGGLSGRGVRFASRHANIRYVEGDLPAMAGQKAALLDRVSTPRDRHVVRPVNALLDEGPDSIDGLMASEFSGEHGTAVVMEDLLNYFDDATARAIVARIARALSRYPRAIFLADVALRDDIARSAAAGAFVRALSAFARGSVTMHFGGVTDAERVLRDAGFSQATVQSPSAWVPRIAGLRDHPAPVDAIRVLDGRLGDWATGAPERAD